MKTISVIIPIYNRASCLEKCLQSVYTQHFRPIELILVDNASSDQSLECCLQFQQAYQSDDFIVKVIEESKRGACIARNTGFKASTGDYLYFFDSDDEMYPLLLSTVFSALSTKNFPEIAAFGSDMDIQGKKTYRPKHYAADAAEQLYDTVLCTHTCIVRRDYLDKTGLWNEQLSRWQDLEFGFRLMLSAGTILWIKKALYLVHFQKNSISGHSYTQDIDLLRQSLKAIYQAIVRQPEKEQKHLLKAYAFKMISVAAILYQEGSREMASEWYQEAKSLPYMKKAGCLPALHYYYERLGGRGCWRFFRALNR